MAMGSSTVGLDRFHQLWVEDRVDCLVGDRSDDLTLLTILTKKLVIAR